MLGKGIWTRFQLLLTPSTRCPCEVNYVWDVPGSNLIQVLGLVHVTSLAHGSGKVIYLCCYKASF